MKPEIHFSSVIRSSEKQLSCSFGEEAAILGTERNLYYSMDEVGARIWELIKSPITIRAIAKHVAEEYEVNISQCETDVVKFINHLYKEGLISVEA